MRPLVIATLSRALDLTEGEPMGHAIRSCWLGMALADAIGLGPLERSRLFYALLLKDAGCSTNAAHVASLLGTDDLAAKRELKTVNWSRLLQATRFAIRNARPGGTSLERMQQIVRMGLKVPGMTRELVSMRCTRGADILRFLGWADLAPDAVLNLDEHWDGSGHPRGLHGEEIPLLARILNLAQHAEIFWNRGGPAAALQVVGQRRGSWFDPALVTAFERLFADPVRWEAMAAVTSPAAIAHLDPDPSPIPLDSPQSLMDVARVFAEIVDAKSPWTAQHSVRTARYGASIASALGESEVFQQEVLLAGLLHDLGKLAVSNLILDKPGRLTPQEFAAMQRHPALTYDILAPLEPLRSLAAIAAAHHERLDGSGYHLGLDEAHLPFMAQVIAVADVFDALTSERPYKRSFTVEEALGIMAPDAGVRLSRRAVTGLITALDRGLADVAQEGTASGPQRLIGAGGPRQPAG